MGFVSLDRYLNYLISNPTSDTTKADVTHKGQRGQLFRTGNRMLAKGFLTGNADPLSSTTLSVTPAYFLVLVKFLTPPTLLLYVLCWRPLRVGIRSVPVMWVTLANATKSTPKSGIKHYLHFYSLAHHHSNNVVIHIFNRHGIPYFSLLLQLSLNIRGNTAHCTGSYYTSTPLRLSPIYQHLLQWDSLYSTKDIKHRVRSLWTQCTIHTTQVDTLATLAGIYREVGNATGPRYSMYK